METKIKFYFSRILIFITLLVKLINSNEDLLKNSKVLSCVSLARSALHKEKNNDKNELSSKILTLLIVRCYRTISPEKSLEILTELNSKSSKDFAWKSEYKEYLGLNSDLISDTADANFAEDFQEVHRILRELNEEANTMKKSMEDNNKSPSESKKANKKKTDTNKTKESDKSSILSLITAPFLTLFKALESLIGFDSFFGVGISIGLVFLFAYLLKKLLSGGAKPGEKRKKSGINKETKKDN